MADIVQALEASLSPDKSQREAALAWLQTLHDSNFAGFVSALAAELANTSRSSVSRQQAGLQLKNALSSNDADVAAKKAAVWRTIDPALRHHVKQTVLSTLGTEQARPSAAAQVLAAIAAAEVEHGLWPDIMRQLAGLLGSMAAAEGGRVAVLETLGYVCESVPSSCLRSEANTVLTILVNAMHAQEPSLAVKTAATKALQNSLHFCEANFHNEAERNAIMQVVCECTQSPAVPLRVAALECLVTIMDLNYRFMENYMRQALFGITLAAMQAADDSIVLQGIEFWSTVGELEIDMEAELLEAQPGQAPKTVSRHYCMGALPHIVPLLLQLMTKQEEGDDSEDWSVCKAAAVCLTLLAQAAPNDILKHVTTFIQTHVSSPSWQHRDAAIMAFGSVMDGPSEEQLDPIVRAGLPLLMSMIQDPSPTVKDSVAWLLSRVIDMLPDVALDDAFLQTLLQTLLVGLQMPASVAANCCWGLRALAEVALEKVTDEESGEAADTFALSKHFKLFVGVLFQVADRQDAGEENLRCAAYEALMSFVSNSTKDCYEDVKQVAVVVIDRLRLSLALNAAHISETQTQLCALLQIVLKQLEHDDIIPLADTVMHVLLAIFQAGSARAVHEDALMAMSALVDALKEDFARYMAAIHPFLVQCVGLTQEAQVCFVAVGVVGDICRALASAVTPYAADYMSALLTSLAFPTLDRSVKPAILSCFGDISTAVGPAYAPYLDTTLNLLSHEAERATQPLPKDDFDLISHTNDLRESCLEAYTGILASVRSPSKNDLAPLRKFVPGIIDFMNKVSMCRHATEECIRAALGLLGDMYVAFGEDLTPIMQPAFTERLVALGKNGKDKTTRDLAKWCRKQILAVHGNK